MNLAKLETYKGFSAETEAAAVTQLATVFGIPLITTHAINSAI